MGKKDIPPRTIYESLLGKRVSDSNWSRLTTACKQSGIVLDYTALKLLVDLKKISPQLVSNVLALKASQPDPLPATSMTGAEVFKRVKELGIKPSTSTLYRWFYKVGVEFSASTIYDSPTVALVLLQAQIYLMKKKRINYARQD